MKRRETHTGPPWTPPPGLERTRPREMRLTAGGQALLVLSALFVIGGAATFVGLSLVSARQAQTLRRWHEQAVDTTGQVTRLWRRGGKQREHRMAYRFSIDGRTYEDDARLSRPAWEALKVGDPVALRYLPSDPKENHPVGRGPRVMPPALPALSGLGLAVTGGLVLLPLLQQRRLLAEGRPAPGRVTRHHKTKKGIQYDFQFVMLSGGRREGKSGPVAKPPAVGEAITVLYDTDDPRRSAPYPLSLVVPMRTAKLSSR
jgi:hypothetical protein